MPELVTESLEEYESRASQLATEHYNAINAKVQFSFRIKIFCLFIIFKNIQRNTNSNNNINNNVNTNIKYNTIQNQTCDGQRCTTVDSELSRLRERLASARLTSHLFWYVSV